MNEDPKLLMRCNATHHFPENRKRDYVYAHPTIETLYYISFVLDTWLEKKMVTLKVYENYFLRLSSVG